MKLYPYKTDDIVIAQKDLLSIRRDWFGFFCQTCYHPHVVCMNYAISSRLDDIDIITDLPAPSVTCIPHFEYWCPKCHHEVEWEGFLDPNITPMLAELNRKGYDTIFSCEGHQTVESFYNNETKMFETTEDCYSCPYIYFKNAELREVCKYVPLLGHWKLDSSGPTKDEFCISVDEQYRDKNENMAYLKRWVDCLPYVEMHEFYPDMITRDIEEKIKQAQQPLTEEELKVEWIKE